MKKKYPVIDNKYVVDEKTTTNKGSRWWVSGENGKSYIINSDISRYGNPVIATIGEENRIEGLPVIELPDSEVCPKCGNKENFHTNYDYSRKEMPIIDILCNECGEFFNLQTSPFPISVSLIIENNVPLQQDGIIKPVEVKYE